MRYSVHFINGKTLSISEERYKNILVQEAVEEEKFYDKDWPYIELNNVTHILPESESASAVIKPKTPQDLKDEAKRREEEIQRDPQKLLERLSKNE